ncbi:MAG: hypothetical protein V3S68_00735 [Dehalococcoidia bacterium]
MIDAKMLPAMIEGLCELVERVGAKDVEGWTLAECDAVKDALARLQVPASLIYTWCMTDQEMAEAEAEFFDEDDCGGDYD